MEIHYLVLGAFRVLTESAGRDPETDSRRPESTGNTLKILPEIILEPCQNETQSIPSTRITESWWKRFL